MAVRDIAARHAAQRVALGRATSAAIGALWREVDRSNIAASWGARLARALSMLFVAQDRAASTAQEYVGRFAAAPSLGQVAPRAFAEVASDGRGAFGLMQRPAIVTLGRIAAGWSLDSAMAAGLFTLDLIVRTQVADAGRTADGVAIVVRPGLSGYVRMVVGDTCARCLILAGRRYEWSDGFPRHPRCDCIHVPAAEDVPGDIRTDPKAYFASLTSADQDRLLGKAGAEAVRSGADIAKVVNARRGMVTADGRLFTTAGRRPRLMPEQIYREAGGSRDEAVRLLRLHGYVI